LGWGVLAYVDEVELVGTCTDICVVSNALILKAMFPALNVKINAAGLKDRAAAEALVKEANEIQTQAQQAEREILAIVESKINA
jgi:glutamate formiminotransferase/formiminotetrahydrofolate cyclodeaminase